MTYEQKEEKVKEIFGDFPLRIVFYLNFDKEENDYSLSFRKTKSKIKIENFKLESLQLFSLSGEVSTPLEVRDFNNFQALNERLGELNDKWIKEDN